MSINSGNEINNSQQSFICPSNGCRKASKDPSTYIAHLRKKHCSEPAELFCTELVTVVSCRGCGTFLNGTSKTGSRHKCPGASTEISINLQPLSQATAGTYGARTPESEMTPSSSPIGRGQGDLERNPDQNSNLVPILNLGEHSTRRSYAAVAQSSPIQTVATQPNRQTPQHHPHPPNTPPPAPNTNQTPPQTQPAQNRRPPRTTPTGTATAAAVAEAPTPNPQSPNTNNPIISPITNPRPASAAANNRTKNQGRPRNNNKKRNRANNQGPNNNHTNSRQSEITPHLRPIQAQQPNITTLPIHQPFPEDRHPELNPTQEELYDLRYTFTKPLFFLASAWMKPFVEITFRLIVGIITAVKEKDEKMEELYTIAFLLLPSVMAFIRVARGPLKVKDFLTYAFNDANPARYICKTALSKRPTYDTPTRPNQERTVTMELLGQRVGNYTKDMRLAAAARCVEQMADFDSYTHQPIPEIETVRQKILSLNPAGDPIKDKVDLDEIVPEGNVETLELLQSAIMDTIQRLPTGSASGVSGWTYNIIRACVFRKDVKQYRADFVQAVSTLFSHMIKGELTCPLWLESRAVLIPKKDSDFRPLGIGEAWYRVMGRAVVLQEGSDIGKELLPYQLGIGLSGGSEIAGRLAQIIIDCDSEMCNISLDLKNAFNLMPRKEMLEGITRFAPQLRELYKWSYGRETNLRLSNGEQVGKSCTGVRQGDALAALFFCLGMHKTLEKIQDIVADASPGIRNSGIPWTEHIAEADRPIMTSDDLYVSQEESPAHSKNYYGVYAYMDDTTIFAPASAAPAICEQLERAFADCGLTLATHKCFVLGAKPEGCKFQHKNAAVVMGTPVGELEDSPDGQPGRKTLINELMTKMIHPLKAFGTKHILAEHAFPILRFCFNAKPVYLSRVLEPDLIKPHLRDFDDSIDKALCASINLQCPPEGLTNNVYRRARIIRGLPTRLSGLGIRRFAGVEMEKGIIKSRSLTRNFISRNLPSILSRGMSEWRPITVANNPRDYFDFLAAEDAFLMPFEEHPEGGDTDPDDRRNRTLRSQNAVGRADMPNLDMVIANYYETVFTMIHQELLAGKQYAEAALFLSERYERSGRWLAGREGMLYGKYGLRGHDFAEALKMRLLVPNFYGIHPTGSEHNCISCRQLVGPNEPFHLAYCTSIACFTKTRHDEIVLALSQLLRRCLPAATQEREPFVNAQIGKRADLLFYSHEYDGKLFIDVTVVNPSAPSYSPAASVTVLAAAQAAYDRKMAQYTVASPALVAEGRILPFVVEVSGRLGERAQMFIDFVTQHSPSDKNKFYDTVSAIVNHNTGQAIYTGRARDQRYSNEHRPVVIPAHIPVRVNGEEWKDDVVDTEVQAN